MSEPELIEKLKVKDQNAFRYYVELNKTRILNICFHFVNDKLDAEDLAQEVFVELYFSINNFKSNSALNTWMYRIAVNKSLDYIKKKKRKKRAAQLLSLVGLNEKDELSLIDSKNPYSILEDESKKILLLKAVNKLPESQKTALILCKYDNMSYSEIAQIMKTSVSAVDSLIQRARKNLKKYLSLEDFI